MIGLGVANLLDTIRRDTPRGRSYSPIDAMVHAIPPGTPITRGAIEAELYDKRLWSLALIHASMDLIIAQLAQQRTHARRAAE